jgi:hypothetical protein
MSIWPLWGPEHRERAWWYGCSFPTASQGSERRLRWTGLGRDERAATTTAARQGGGGGGQLGTSFETQRPLIAGR